MLIPASAQFYRIQPPPVDDNGRVDLEQWKQSNATTFAKWRAVALEAERALWPLLGAEYSDVYEISLRTVCRQREPFVSKFSGMFVDDASLALFQSFTALYLMQWPLDLKVTLSNAQQRFLSHQKSFDEWVQSAEALKKLLPGLAWECSTALQLISESGAEYYSKSSLMSAGPQEESTARQNGSPNLSRANDGQSPIPAGASSSELASDAPKKGRRGRLPKNESVLLKTKMLALLREHPTFMENPELLADQVGISESTVRRWIDEFRQANMRRG